MKHYICAGECAGISKVSGVCSAEDCSLHGQPLEECNCADPIHNQGGAGDAGEETESEE